MMPSIEDNIQCWGKKYHWNDRGDEWSSAWGGTEYLWYGTIFPRIMQFVPVHSILEIAPGYGRCTQYLEKLCLKMQVVDLNQNCIDSCRNRFTGSFHIEYFVNDGKSLGMISDNSVDFLFSWDSLVHCEADVLKAYVAESARILKPNGCGFIHHSNLGSYRNTLAGALTCENPHSRGITMSAKLFNDFCMQYDLICMRQEIVNWGGPIMNDCFSVFVKSPLQDLGPAKVIENGEFGLELKHICDIAGHYNM